MGLNKKITINSDEYTPLYNWGFLSIKPPYVAPYSQTKQVLNVQGTGFIEKCIMSTPYVDSTVSSVIYKIIVDGETIFHVNNNDPSNQSSKTVAYMGIVSENNISPINSNSFYPLMNYLGIYTLLSIPYKIFQKNPNLITPETASRITMFRNKIFFKKSLVVEAILTLNNQNTTHNTGINFHYEGGVY